ncbi:MAG: DUF503 domain-containing protein [Proteobacteria bacterium]|nr:DUF503 domain-containing protein [Pseudomonadota bacterium]
MYVGLCAIDLHIEHAQSLKEKRQVLRKVLDNIRNKFPVSVAEVDKQDLWQRAIIGIAVVSSSSSLIDEIFSKIEDFIENLHLCSIIDIKREIFTW